MCDRSLIYKWPQKQNDRGRPSGCDQQFFWNGWCNQCAGQVALAAFGKPNAFWGWGKKMSSIRKQLTWIRRLGQPWSSCSSHSCCSRLLLLVVSRSCCHDVCVLFRSSQGHFSVMSWSFAGHVIVISQWSFIQPVVSRSCDTLVVFGSCFLVMPFKSRYVVVMSRSCSSHGSVNVPGVHSTQAFMCFLGTVLLSFPNGVENPSFVTIVTFS